MEFIQESAIEPDLPIIDCHHHLWNDPPPVPSSDIQIGTLPSYLLPEILADVTAGHNVQATVYVEAGSNYRSDGPEALRPVGETEFANAVAEENRRSGGRPRICAGIVANVNMMLGAGVEEVLEAHRAAAPERFRGIRHLLLPDPMAGEYVDTERVMLQPAFREALGVLGRRKVHFEIMVFHPQLADVIATVRACPDESFVLNHVGGPLGMGSYEGKREEVWHSWKQDIATLGKEPNVVVKLGGLSMFSSPFRWHRQAISPSSDVMAEAFKPYLDHVIESFTPQRAMFESNFPPDSISARYVTLWNAFKKATTHYSAAERAGLFHDNAARVYRL